MTYYFNEETREFSVDMKKRRKLTRAEKGALIGAGVGLTTHVATNGLIKDLAKYHGIPVVPLSKTTRAANAAADIGVASLIGAGIGKAMDRKEKRKKLNKDRLTVLAKAGLL